MKELPTTRVPLSELPLSDYVRDPNLPLSPVSLPLKRPATPKNATATPKRVVVELDADELGTGRSPARRLFDATPRAARQPGTPGLSRNTAGGDGIASSSGSSGFVGGLNGGSNGSVGGLAPSPPLRSRRGSDALPTPASSSTSVSSSSTSTSTNTPSSGRHDPGFVIFSDDDVLARPVSQTFVPISDTDEENVPPPAAELEVEIEATPRRKRFEPSKLSTVTTSASPAEERKERRGKQGMIDEADEA